MHPKTRPPLRGEIWFVKLPTDPPEKRERPVIVVSLDARNRSERAETVLVIPLSTTVHKDVPTHVYLTTGETGLAENSVAKAEDITVVRKSSLSEARQPLRRVSDLRMRELADKVGIAMGCLPDSL